VLPLLLLLLLLPPSAPRNTYSQKAAAHTMCMCACIVLQTAVIQLAAKRKARVTDSYFEEMCRLNATKLMAPGNFYPRSYYLMKKVVGTKDARDIQVCACT
jgi:hypothetical protein